MGLARKIGCDVAVKLFSSGIVSSSLVYSTDADVILPLDYFSVVPQDNSIFIFPFKHRYSSFSYLHKKAIVSYLDHIEKYKKGLEYAGSLYAVDTLGSVLAFSIDVYVKVRGFPRKRLAGEDFYFLNKALKISSVVPTKVSKITLSGRFSSRVPFGTGCNSKKILYSFINARGFNSYEYYSFFYLKIFLCRAKKSCEQQQMLLFENKYDFATTFTYNDCLFSKILKLRNLEKRLLISLISSSCPLSRKKHFCDWFDAFETLKFINLSDRLLQTP